MTHQFIVAAAFAAVFSGTAKSQVEGPRPAPGLTLRGAVDSALKNNLDLRTARSTGDSARSETRIARALPNPIVATVPNTPFQYSATLPLDIGPQRTFRVQVSDLGARAAQSDIRESARQVVLAVRRAFMDVLLADARREIVAGRRDVMRQLVVADSARVRAGDLPEGALIRSQIELIRAEADVERTGIDAQSTRLVLQGLMGVAVPDTALRVEGDLQYHDIDFDPDARARTALADRPDVMASRDRESQSVAAQEFAHSLVLPVPQLSYVRQFDGPFESGHYYAFGIGFELPILNQYGGQRERADAAHEAASYARRRAESQAVREIQTAIVEFRAQRTLVHRYESGVIAKMEQNVDAARYAYSRGATSLLEVLDALRTQQDMLTDYRTALHDYWVAVYTVEAATGVVAQ